MIDLERVLALCSAALPGVILVGATYLFTMREVRAEINDWRIAAVEAQAIADDCLALLAVTRREAEE